MSVASRARALLSLLTAEDFENMRPDERARFADLCRDVARRAEPPVQRPSAGILYDLRDGARPD